MSGFEAGPFGTEPARRQRGVSMNLPPGVRSDVVTTDRLRMHYLESGPEDGIPVLLIHGNLSTGRFYEHLFPGAPDGYRLIAPDMRGFGDTERLPIDARSEECRVGKE